MCVVVVFHWLFVPAHFFSRVQPKCRVVIYSLSLKAKLDWQISMILLCLPGFGLQKMSLTVCWQLIGPLRENLLAPFQKCQFPFCT